MLLLNQLWISGLHGMYGVVDSTIAKEVFEPENDVRNVLKSRGLFENK